MIQQICKSHKFVEVEFSRTGDSKTHIYLQCANCGKLSKERIDVELCTTCDKPLKPHEIKKGVCDTCDQ